MKTYFSFILLLFSISGYCQNWPKVFTGTTYIWSRDLLEFYDRGYLLTIQIDPGSLVPKRYSWLLKTDVNGNQLWKKSVQSNSYSLTLLDSDATGDGIVSIGSTYKLDPDFNDIVFLKLNNCGEKEWCNILYSHQNSEYGIKIKTIPDGYISLLQYYKNWIDKRIWLIKLNSSGTILWEQSYLDTVENIFNEQPRDLTVCTDGGFIITGDGFFEQENVFQRPLFIKTSADGTQQWILPFGQNNGFRGFLPCYTQENINGSFYSAAIHFRDSLPTGDSPCFLKVSQEGSEEFFSDLVSNSISGGSTTLDLHNNDSLFISAAWYDENNISKIGLFKTDTLGNISDTNILFVDTPYGIHSTFFTYDDYYMAAGYFSINNSKTKIYLYKFTRNLELAPLNTQPLVYDSLCDHPIASDTINLDDCNVITKIDDPETDPEAFAIRIFPNPASDHLTIEIPEKIVRKTTAGSYQVTTIFHQWENSALEIFDLTGNLICSQKITSKTKSITLNTSSWHSGMYAVRIVYKNQVVAVGKVMVT